MGAVSLQQQIALGCKQISLVPKQCLAGTVCCTPGEGWLSKADVRHLPAYESHLDLGRAQSACMCALLWGQRDLIQCNMLINAICKGCQAC